MTPILLTSAGSCGSTCDTRFWVSTAAMSGSVSSPNCTVTEDDPSALETALIDFMPVTPLICESSGAVTPSSTTSALAPG